LAGAKVGRFIPIIKVFYALFAPKSPFFDLRQKNIAFAQKNPLG